MKKFLIAALALAVAGCTDTDSATRVLKQSGYSNVHITGYRYFGCGKEDSLHTGFTASGPTGEPVSGVVCSGVSLFGKNNTVRLD